MTIINENTVVVFTAAELKTSLENKNSYTYIYLGSNIKLTSGISISNTKENVTIDGTYNGIKYTYEDMNSLGTNDTISARNKNIKQVTVRNMNIIGHNYYGVIFIPEDNNLSNIIVEYNNISYQGPQITFHPTGLTRYIDCNISIITSYAAANEVAECNRIEIGGTTNINHASTGDSMFWFRGSNAPYFKILINANVTMVSEARELFYGVTNLAFSVLENAYLSLTTYRGIGYNNYSTNNVLIDKNAVVKITQTGSNGSYPTWYCNGPFVMEEGSTLHMINSYSGITANNYNIAFVSSQSSFTLNNPKELVLYNSKADVIHTNTSIPFSLQYSRINLWNKAASINIAGSINDIPTNAWYKNNALSLISGTIAENKTTIQSNNYTDEELSSLPNINNFTFQGTPVLSIGKGILNIDSISDEQTLIKGHANSLADVKISYDDSAQIVRSDENGFYQLTLPNTLPIGTKIYFIANVPNSFIYQSKDVQIIYAGELTLDNAPEIIQFELIPFSTNPILCPRSTEVNLTVTDTRVDSSDWKLYASIDHDLTSANGFILPNSLVNKEDNTITILSTTPTLVYQGKNNQGEMLVTNVNWPNEQGILLRITDTPVVNGEIYKTNIIWSIEE